MDAYQNTSVRQTAFMISNSAAITLSMLHALPTAGAVPHLTDPVPTLSWLQALIIGLVQGLSEFLPISSSAHLRIIPALFQQADPGAAVSAIIQLGTTGALVVYFWQDIVRITKALFIAIVRIRTAGLRGSVSTIESESQRHDATVGWYIIGATIPIGIFGLIFQSAIETVARSLYVISATLIVFGIILWWADATFPARKSVREFTWGNTLIMGLAQTLALIPGVSRSGATITAGRVLGFSREAAARFSFLLSIPAIVLSGLYEAAKNINTDGVPWGPTLLALVVAFLSGYAAIAWLLKYLVNHSMRSFAIYRVVVGAVVFTLAITEAIK